MHSTYQVFRSFEFSLHKSLVNNYLRRDVGEFTPLPGLYLFPHGFEVAVQPPFDGGIVLALVRIARK
jgi:hypothetical protein